MSRGGKRADSGRKKLSEERKRVQVSLSVSPETKRRITELRERKVKVGEVIDELVRQYCEEET